MMAWTIPNVQSPISNIGSVPDVSDPWYTGDFTKAYDDILEGCQAMLKQI